MDTSPDPSHPHARRRPPSLLALCSVAALVLGPAGGAAAAPTTGPGDAPTAGALGQVLVAEPVDGAEPPTGSEPPGGAVPAADHAEPTDGGAQAGAAANTPTVRVMQTQVELWNDIRVLGEGFAPGTQLAVVIGDDGLGLETTIHVDENGRFDKWLPTSGLQPGYHAVHFTERASGTSWSADVLLYNPLRARAVTEVPWVDQPVTVEGSASFAGHEVTVTLRGTDTTVSTTAAGDGTFSVQLPTTGLVPGTYAFDVVDRVTGNSVANNFVLTAGEQQHTDGRVTVVPGNPVAGEPFGVEGTGYEPGTALRVAVLGTGVGASVSAGADGAFSVTLPTGALAPRDYVVAVTDGTGRELARTTVLVQPAEAPADPSLTVRPGNPGSGEPVTVNGTGFEPHREMTLMAWGLHDAAVATVVVGADGTFSVALPTGHLYPGAEYHVTVTDTVSGQEFLVLFSVPAYLTVAVTTPVPRVGESLSVEGTGTRWGVTITVRGTGRSYEPDLDEDGTYWVDVPTEGLAPGEHTVVAVSGYGHYAETTFTLAAAEGDGPNGAPGPPPKSPAPTPEVPEPEVPTPEAPASQAPQRPGNPGALPEPVVAGGSPLPPPQSGPPAAAAASSSAPAAHGWTAAAAAPPGPAGHLPRTGAGIAHDAAVALSLMLLGAGALGLARSRRMDR